MSGRGCRRRAGATSIGAYRHTYRYCKSQTDMKMGEYAIYEGFNLAIQKTLGVLDRKLKGRQSPFFVFLINITEN